MSPRRGRIPPATLFFAALSLLLAVALYLQSRRTFPSKAPVRPAERTAAPRGTAVPPDRAAPARRPAPLRKPSPPPPARDSSRPARVAIIIDDLGNDPEAVERIARWPYPVGGAVLPRLPGSAWSARRLGESGKDVLLHLPMEPIGYPGVRPGPGVVLRSQSDEEVVRTLLEDLDTVPGAVGVNNHMGSAATSDPRVMGAIVGVLARRGLFFVDSRTTDSTVARRMAQEARLPTVSRRVFLDRVVSEPAITAAFAELLRRAREEGAALALGHPHPATLAVLERELPGLAREGISLVRVRELVE